MGLAYIGLGSNLGDSRGLLIEAVRGLAALGPIRVSRLYASAPMGPQDQPDYLNAAVELQTAADPLELLDQLQALEQTAGRVRGRHWGERTLDLDLLLLDDAQIQTDRLTLPHAGILQRAFVIQPLLDLNPDFMVAGQRLSALALAHNAVGIRAVAANNWVDV